MNPEKAKAVTELLAKQIELDLKIIAIISFQAGVNPNTLHRLFIESHQKVLKRQEAKK